MVTRNLSTTAVEESTGNKDAMVGINGI